MYYNKNYKNYKITRFRTTKKMNFTIHSLYDLLDEVKD